ncbi:MAG: SLC13/DASS family transporter [Calditrichaeota bacterium]|nr:MAG: SLC13/DASS family transporter [Calditrichota bacterium]
MNPSTDQRRRNIFLVIAPLLSTLMILFVDLQPGRPEITRTAAIALLMAIWWMTEALPLAVTSLLPMVLFPALGIMSGKEVAPIYFNHIIFLFIGGFIVALAMERWNLHKRIALRILLTVGLQPGRILLGFILSTAFLSMWISNTATTMMMVPIALAIVYHLEESLPRRQVSSFATGIFLAIAYSASIGGVATLVGTPPNLAFVRIFSIQFPQAPEITFATWILFGLPVSILFLVILWILLARQYTHPIGDLTLEDEVIRRQYRELGKMAFEEKIVLVDFVALVLLWLFRQDVHLGTVTVPGWSNLFAHPEYLNDGVVAIALALVLFLVPSRRSPTGRLMDWKTAVQLPWGIVLLFGGGFAVASGFKESGLSGWIGQQFTVLGGLHPLLIIAVVCLIITFLTELTSNTATAQILLPILAELAVATRLNPLLLMVPGTIACSFAFMLPVATPPNAIVFGTERLRIGDMVRTGLWLNFIGTAIITLAIYLLGGPIFHIDPGNFPVWAR